MNSTMRTVSPSAGLRKMSVYDAELDLSFPVLLFYPASAKSEEVMIGPFPFEVAEDAEPDEGEHPIVLISHGSGGSQLVYRTLAIHLAKHGFMVCLPEHPFNNRNNNSWEHALENLIHRPRHLSLVLDHLISDESMKNHIRKDRVAIIGHSMGGYGALVAAGAIPRVDHLYNPDYIRYMFDLPRGPLDVRRDERVKAIVLFAPAAVWFIPDNSLDGVRVPVLIYTAEKDEYTAGQETILLEGLPDQEKLDYRRIENAGHFSFLSPFPDSIRERVGPVAKDPEGFDRNKFQSQLSREVTQFLTEALHESIQK